MKNANYHRSCKMTNDILEMFPQKMTFQIKALKFDQSEHRMVKSSKSWLVVSLLMSKNAQIAIDKLFTFFCYYVAIMMLEISYRKLHLFEMMTKNAE